jgi:hypothetical protein
VTSPSKRKGDAAELEAARILHDLLGVPARRKLGAGRSDDTGDIDGLKDTVIQVVSRSTDVVAVGIVRKPLEADQQARNAGVSFAATMLRVRGGTWRVVLTPESFAALWREAQPTS